MIIINVLALVLAYLSYFIYFISEGDKLGLGDLIINDFISSFLIAIISFILAMISILKGCAMLTKGMKIEGRISLIAGIGSWIVLATLPTALFIDLILTLSYAKCDHLLGDKVLLGFNLVLLCIILILIYRTTKLRKKAKT